MSAGQRAPYPGLRPFNITESDIFKGREAEKQNLAAVVLTRKVTVLCGAPGVGKTSLLYAGLTEVLAGESASLTLVREPDEMDSFLERFATNGLPGAKMKNLTEFVTEHHAKWPNAARRSNPSPGKSPVHAPPVIVLDQFERLLWDKDRVGRAIAVAEAITQQDAHLVISLREDALSLLTKLRDRIRGVLESVVRVADLTPEGARAAIEGPVLELAEGGAKYSIESTLVTRLLGELGEEYPWGREYPAFQIQLVMRRLWGEALARASVTSPELPSGETGRGDNPVELTLDLVGDRPIRMVPSDHVREAVERLPLWHRPLLPHVVDALISNKRRLTRPATEISTAARASLVRTRWFLGVAARGDDSVLRAVGERADPKYEVMHDILVEPLLDWSSTAKQQGARARWVVAALVAGFAAALLTRVLVQNAMAECRSPDKVNEAPECWAALRRSWISHPMEWFFSEDLVLEQAAALDRLGQHEGCITLLRKNRAPEQPGYKRRVERMVECGIGKLQATIRGTQKQDEVAQVLGSVVGDNEELLGPPGPRSSSDRQNYYSLVLAQTVCDVRPETRVRGGTPARNEEQHSVLRDAVQRGIDFSMNCLSDQGKDLPECRRVANVRCDRVALSYCLFRGSKGLTDRVSNLTQAIDARQTLAGTDNEACDVPDIATMYHQIGTAQLELATARIQVEPRDGSATELVRAGLGNFERAFDAWSTANAGALAAADKIAIPIRAAQQLPGGVQSRPPYIELLRQEELRYYEISRRLPLLEPPDLTDASRARDMLERAANEVTELVEECKTQECAKVPDAVVNRLELHERAARRLLRAAEATLTMKLKGKAVECRRDPKFDRVLSRAWNVALRSRADTRNVIQLEVQRLRNVLACDDSLRTAARERTAALCGPYVDCSKLGKLCPTERFACSQLYSQLARMTDNIAEKRQWLGECTRFAGPEGVALCAQ